MQRNAEHVRGVIPAAEKADLDQLCQTYRKRLGLHYGQTMAACLVIGIQEIKRTGYMPDRVVELVR